MASSRPRRQRWASIGRIAALAVVVVTVLAGAGIVGAGSAHAADGPAARAPLAAASGSDDPVAPDDEGPTSGDNDFWPEERDIGDCLGALERPGCGSDQRGGWRQAIVFGVVVLALAVVGWRLFLLVRRRDVTPTTTDDDEAGHDGADRAGGDDSDSDSGHESDRPANDPPSRSGV